MPAYRQNLGTAFLGSAGTITVAMSPAESTAGWTVAARLRKGAGGTVLATMTATVGQGAGGASITVTFAASDTSTLAPGTYHYEVIRTDSGGEDVLVFGSMTFDYPAAA